MDVSYKGEKAPKSPYRVYHQPRKYLKPTILFNRPNNRAILRLIINTAGVTLNYELKGVVNGKIGETIRVTIEVKEEESKRAYGNNFLMRETLLYPNIFFVSVVDASAFDIVISGPETLKYILDDNKYVFAIFTPLIILKQRNLK